MFREYATIKGYEGNSTVGKLFFRLGAARAGFPRAKARPWLPLPYSRSPRRPPPSFGEAVNRAVRLRNLRSRTTWFDVSYLNPSERIFPVDTHSVD